MREVCLKLLFVFCLAYCFGSFASATAAKHIRKKALDEDSKIISLSEKHVKTQPAKYYKDKSKYKLDLETNNIDKDLKTAKTIKNFSKIGGDDVSVTAKNKESGFSLKLGPQSPSDTYKSSQHIIRDAELRHEKRARRNSPHEHNSPASVAEQERLRSLGPTFTPIGPTFTPTFSN